MEGAVNRMSAPDAPIELPGGIRQIGYVVDDVERAMRSWLALGIGPWYVLRRRPQRARYRGMPCEVTVTIAFSHSGEVQLELIQQHDETPSIFTEFLAGGAGGFHQLAWWPTDFDAALKTVTDGGYSVVWSGGEPGGVRFAYFEPPLPTAPIIELSEFTDSARGLADMVRAAADDWNGSDPVRSLPGS